MRFICEVRGGYHCAAYNWETVHITNNFVCTTYPNQRRFRKISKYKMFERMILIVNTGILLNVYDAADHRIDSLKKTVISHKLRGEKNSNKIQEIGQQIKTKPTQKKHKFKSIYRL